MSEKRGEEDHDDEDIHGHGVGKIDDAEQLAARHALDAVLAAGELRLQREEVHHLRERERDHREIDALAADGDAADDDAEDTGDQGATKDRERRRLRRQRDREPLPRAGPVRQAHRADLGDVGRDIGCPAEEHRVAERQQAAIADQQVEGAGEQRKAQRLHQEHRIDLKRRQRRQHQHRDHHRERDLHARRHIRSRQGGDVDGGHVRLPVRTGRPAGSAARSP